MKLLVIDTMQYFEIEVEDHIDPEDYIYSDECRAICADRIRNQTTDLDINQVAFTKDADGHWETH